VASKNEKKQKRADAAAERSQSIHHFNRLAGKATGKGGKINEKG